MNTKEIVLALIEAINQEDFSKARTYTTDDLQFEGVLASRDGADAYFSDMEKMKMKYDVKKIFVDGDDVCVLSEINMKNTPVFTCSLYHLRDGKVDRLKVIFDPRPALATKQ